MHNGNIQNMIKIIKKPVDPIDANSYTVIDTETKKCLLIDFGADFSRLMKSCGDLGLTVSGAILTHGHFDHAMSGYLAKERGVKVYVPVGDEKILYSDDNLAKKFGVIAPFYHADEVLNEGETEIGGIKIKVISTPGHTKGSSCFLIDGKLFTGDTLFYGSYGNTSFPGGSFAEIKDSITNKLFKLDGDYEIFPGHGENTHLDYERKYNYINDDNY